MKESDARMAVIEAETKDRMAVVEEETLDKKRELMERYFKRPSVRARNKRPIKQTGKGTCISHHSSCTGTLFCECKNKVIFTFKDEI